MPCWVSGVAGAVALIVAKVDALTAGFASPKSSSLAPDFVSMTLPGFRSRCTTPLRCARFQTIRHLRAIFQRFGEWDRPFAETLLERLALQIFHDEEISAILMADVVKNANVGVVQTGDGARLPLKSLPGFGIGGEMRGQNLDCHIAAEPRVAGAIDFSHTAGAQRCDNFVWTRSLLPGFRTMP